MKAPPRSATPSILDDPLLVLEEVAEAIRQPVSSCRYLIQVGKLAAIRPGRRVLVRRSELERFLASGGAR